MSSGVTYQIGFVIPAGRAYGVRGLMSARRIQLNNSA
jgi:hypothetical protein